MHSKSRMLLLTLYALYPADIIIFFWKAFKVNRNEGSRMLAPVQICASVVHGARLPGQL